jgi:putative ABC transport system permease protein
MRDIRYAVRVLLKTPGFTLIALIALALGIGANTAIFSVVSGVLLRPLQFAEPARLMQVNETFLPNGTGTVSFPTLQDWRAQSSSFESLIAYQNTSKNLQDVATPERIATVSADRGLFRMLGVEPIAGRTFRDDDPPHVVVVGEGFWKRRFGGDPSFVGKQIKIDGESFTVIGIMPEAFQFPYRASYTELWIPQDIAPAQAHQRGNHFLFVVGRLKSAATVDSARNEMGVIAKRLEAQYPENNSGRGVLITPLSEVVVGRVRPALLTLLGAVGLVLLIACANVANLLLARAAARGREVAIRTALGAGRARLIRQFLTESIILALTGGAAGLALAAWGTQLLIALAGPQIPRSWEIGLDWRVFLFLFLVCVITGIGFGLAPALAASRVNVQNGLKEGSGRGSAGRGSSRIRDGLVVAEIALAFVLLMGAGLMLRAFLSLQSTQTGLHAENVVALRMSISESEYGAPGASGRYYQAIEDRVTQIPGVSAAGFIQLLPLQDWGWNGNFSIDGRPHEVAAREPLAEFRYITPGYFHALGIPILKGRDLTTHDNLEGPPVAVINDAFARQYFPGEDPVGKHTTRGTIVGVVGDVRQIGLDRPSAPEFYFPLAQDSILGVSLVVRGQIPPETLVSGIRDAIRQINPNQAVFGIKTMQRVVADSLADRNLYLWLLGLFAGLALALAVAGIYGVISYAVTARTQEFGIRLALGADAGRVLGLVLWHGVALVGLGLALGVAGAFGLTRLLKSLLVGVTPTDPATFAVVGVLLPAVALMACLIPARRAMRVDPIVALRYE